MAGTALLIGGAVPSFAENANITPEVRTIADDGETVLEGVTEDVKAKGGLVPTALDQLLETEEEEPAPLLTAGNSTMGLFAAPQGALVGAAELPSSFCYDNLPEAASQGNFNTCWAFSTMKSAEISLLKSGFGEGLNLSELQMLYGLFYGKDDVFLDDTKVGWYNAPGNYVRATAALARHYGAADESVYPYDRGFSFSENDLTADVAVIDHVVWPGNWPTAESDWKGTAWEEKNQAIKEILYEIGAVTASYNSSNSAYSSSLNSSYTAWTSGSVKPAADHSILLVGWDDEKETQGGTGAFLAMNSWGTDWGENGLFWISYNDASLADPAAYIMEARTPGAVRDDTVYCYTGVGFAQTVRSTRAVAGANIFTAESETVLDRVGFYLPENASYTARILTDLADPADPTSGTEAAVISGTVVYGGFYKADVPELVTVDAGETFAVELTVTAGSRNCVLFEYISTQEKSIVCNAGESFYYNGSVWTDSAAGIVISGSTYNLGNIPIYVYGISESESPVPGDADADGETTLKDLLTLLRGSTGQEDLTNYGRVAADMDDDGDNDDGDAELLSIYLVENAS